MRGLCAASRFEKVQQNVTSRPIRLGSFSEAQNVFGPGLLKKAFTHLLAHLLAQSVRRQPIRNGIPGRRILELVDSSVFAALPRMTWTLWHNQNARPTSAVRLHLKFRLFEEIPSGAIVSKAKLCEREAFEKMVEPAQFFVGDRNFSRSYQLLQRLVEAGNGVIVRACENINFTVLEDLPLDEQDRKSGVVSDQIVSLGSREKWHCGPFRMVRIEKPELDEPLILITSESDPRKFSAALVGEIYHQRWAIEQELTKKKK